MESIKTIFKIGSGPSSSHTMGPELAVKEFKKLFDVDQYEVELYGSLALTGKGHLTDYIIKETFKPIEGKVIFDLKKDDLAHPNQMKIKGYKKGELIAEYEIASVGGGNIVQLIDGQMSSVKEDDSLDVYEHSKLSDIIDYCENNNISLIQYILDREGEDLKDYLQEIYEVMKDAINRGINTKGIIPGKLNLIRRASNLYESYKDDPKEKEILLSSYAYAVNEENASGGKIVTAPTCGACGVLPSLLKYYQDNHNIEEEKIIEALMIAGLIGTITRENATISGAEGGCQAEVGAATAMGAAAIMYLMDNNAPLRKINAAAEIGLGHQLGLTCDPVLGYVQIPCIQRNPMGANKALVAAKLADKTLDEELVDFDSIVEVMYQTGKDLKSEYRETSTGGIAKFYKGKSVK